MITEWPKTEIEGAWVWVLEDTEIAGKFEEDESGRIDFVSHTHGDFAPGAFDAGEYFVRVR